MSEHQASRTLLKSPPELWAECSDAQSLARHLDTLFGEIRITRLEPENAVAWEGERGSGTVRLEPAGWGTKVTLTASSGEGSEPEITAQTATGPEDSGQQASAVPARTPWRPATFLARFLRHSDAEPPGVVPMPERAAPEPAEPPTPASHSGETADALAAALESLGQAHHRPFSRA